MQKLFSAEELIMDDSFINYCNKSNPADISRWELYIHQFPHEKEKVEEARVFVLGIKRVLHTDEKKKALEHFMEVVRQNEIELNQEREEYGRYVAMNAIPLRRRKNYWWYVGAAAVAVIFISLWLIPGGENHQRVSLSDKGVAERTPMKLLLTENSRVQTGIGEKRVIYLPDSTKVTLNAKTVLEVDSAFGRKTRLVRLEGEAFFDVTQDAGSPFIVRMKDFDVKVLGTMFNVRSYAADKTSETSLVKGKVEITLKDNPDNKLLLKPNEKAVLSHMGNFSFARRQRESVTAQDISSLIGVIKPLTISSDGNSVIETGWIQDRLEINDETFEELKNTLERQYGVNISFEDEEVKKYKFTATFDKEDIDEVLNAMQLSYSFNYTRNKNYIIVRK